MALSDIVKEEIKTTGRIIDIKITTYDKAFRNPEKALSKAKNPEAAKQRLYAIFTVETEEGTIFTETHGVPKGARYNEETGEWEVVDKIALSRSMDNLNNWFVQYNAKYKKDPQIGDEVEVKMNERGFLQIVTVR